ncbi:hypothetical protein NLG97_g6204 [Lecanicillium saksenae]|uniref:Uncharacterized protein n=1 Tax=Lecanicillium saksenae TaxID=468837 RepID=A0ACC1QQB0_9HYPO|nr:hypothetical protein NLG97_g6204 [Lecanicillium saksenae]
MDAAGLREAVAQPPFPAEPDPPDWDYMQCVRYYMTVHRPRILALLGPRKVPAFHIRNSWSIRFMCQMVCCKIENLARVRGKLLVPGEDSSMSGLWQSYWRFMHEQLALVNKLVCENPPKIEEFISALMQLMRFDLVAKGNTWQKHMDGLFAYIESIGGVGFVLKQTKPAPVICALLRRTIICNTTSPARMQVLGYDRYTDKQLTQAFKLFHLHEMPCPSDLFLVVVHVTRIRQRASVINMLNREPFEAAVQQVFTDIDRFDETVSSKAKRPKDEGLKEAIPRIFKVAVRLYAIMTLPRTAVLAAFPNVSSYRELRASQRYELMEGLKIALAAMASTDESVVLGWPMMVAGVAAGVPHSRYKSDDPDYEYALSTKKTVESYFYAHWLDPISTCVELAILEQLRNYWRSGGTEWEECFYQPTPS